MRNGFNLPWKEALLLMIGIVTGSVAATVYLSDVVTILESQQFNDFVLKTKITDWLVAFAAIAAVWVAAKALQWNRFQTQRPLIAERDETLASIYDYIEHFFNETEIYESKLRNKNAKDIDITINYLEYIRSKINNTQDRMKRNYIARNIPYPFTNKLGPRGRFVDYNKKDIADSFDKQVEVFTKARDEMLTSIMRTRIKFDRYNSQFLDF